MEKDSLKQHRFAFFMNYYSSLETWDRFGMFSREIRLYNELAKRFGHLYIFTYGDRRDLGYADRLEKNITVIPKTLPLPDALYEFLIPFIHFRIIRKCSILKTNQNSGTIAPAIARLFLSKTRFIVRSGYIGSEFSRLNRLPFYARAYFWFAEQLSYHICDRAFIPSSDAPTLERKYPFLKSRIIRMNNAIDTDLFTKENLLKNYDIIYLARLDGKQKNHFGLLQAINGLGLKVLFIGRGPEKDSLIAQAKKDDTSLEIIEKVPNEKIPSYCNASRLCVFPSLFEGNPKALLEAMSCEMPIVAFDVPGVNGLIENEISGLLSSIDPTAMRENIQRLLDDPALGARLGAAAREHILEHFSFKSLLEKELGEYNSLQIKK